MGLALRRLTFSEQRTLGELWIDGQFECYTLEDPVREDDPTTPVDEGRKVYGETAIPAGRYRVTMGLSPKFGRVPFIHDVPGFTDIRIHAGNREQDTKGCPLVGQTLLDLDGEFGPDAIGRSRLALVALIEKLDVAEGRGEECWIMITNERGVWA